MDTPEMYLQDEYLPADDDNYDGSIYIVDSQDMDNVSNNRLTLQADASNNDCRTGSSTTASAIERMKVKHPLVKIPCPWCPKVLKKYEIQVHVAQEHGKGKSDISELCSTLGSRMHRCRLCNKIFSRLYENINSHLRVCHRKEHISVGRYLDLYYHHIEEEEEMYNRNNGNDIDNIKEDGKSTQAPDENPLHLGNEEYGATSLIREPLIPEHEQLDVVRISPGGFSCPRCAKLGLIFATFEEADSHIREQHGVDDGGTLKVSSVA